MQNIAVTDMDLTKWMGKQVEEAKRLAEGKEKKTMKLTELELLYVLLLLAVDGYEEHSMVTRFERNLAAGVFTRLERLPETSELFEKLRSVNSAKVFDKFLTAAEELKLVTIEQS